MKTDRRSRNNKKSVFLSQEGERTELSEIFLKKLSMKELF